MIMLMHTKSGIDFMHHELHFSVFMAGAAGGLYTLRVRLLFMHRPQVRTDND